MISYISYLCSKILEKKVTFEIHIISLLLKTEYRPTLFLRNKVINILHAIIYTSLGILWDCRWIAPSIGIFSPHMICLQKCIYNHETKQSFKFQSDPSSNCFTIDVWNINCWLSTVYFVLSYCFLYLILHKFCRGFDT